MPAWSPSTTFKDVIDNADFQDLQLPDKKKVVASFLDFHKVDEGVRPRYMGLIETHHSMLDSDGLDRQRLSGRFEAHRQAVDDLLGATTPEEEKAIQDRLTGQFVDIDAKHNKAVEDYYGNLGLAGEYESLTRRSIGNIEARDFAGIQGPNAAPPTSGPSDREIRVTAIKEQLGVDDDVLGEMVQEYKITQGDFDGKAMVDKQGRVRVNPMEVLKDKGAVLEEIESLDTRPRYKDAAKESIDDVERDILFDRFETRNGVPGMQEAPVDTGWFRALRKRFRGKGLLESDVSPKEFLESSTPLKVLGTGDEKDATLGDVVGWRLQELKDERGDESDHDELVLQARREVLNKLVESDSRGLSGILSRSATNVVQGISQIGGLAERALLPDEVADDRSKQAGGTIAVQGLLSGVNPKSTTEKASTAILSELPMLGATLGAGYFGKKGAETIARTLLKASTVSTAKAGPRAAIGFGAMRSAAGNAAQVAASGGTEKEQASAAAAGFLTTYLLASGFNTMGSFGGVEQMRGTLNAAKSSFRATLGGGAKGAVGEATEEALDTVANNLITQAAGSPDTPIAEAVNGAGMSALVGGLLGGGTSAVMSQASNNKAYDDRTEFIRILQDSDNLPVEPVSAPDGTLFPSDSSYMSAVQEGDLEKAQSMVDDVVRIYGNQEQDESPPPVEQDEFGVVVPLSERFLSEDVKTELIDEKRTPMIKAIDHGVNSGMLTEEHGYWLEGAVYEVSTLGEARQLKSTLFDMVANPKEAAVPKESTGDPDYDPGPESQDRSITSGDQILNISALPSPESSEAEASRVALGLPPLRNDNPWAKAIYKQAARNLDYGSLPKTLRQILRQSQYRVTGFTNMFNRMGRDLNIAIKDELQEHYGRKIPFRDDSAPKIQARKRLTGTAYNALRGDEEAFNALPDNIAAKVKTARDFIDAFGRKLVEDGVVEKKLAEAVEDNIGEYLLREFRVHRPEEDWHYDTIRRDHPDVYEKALKDIQESSGSTKEDADLIIRTMTHQSKGDPFYHGKSSVETKAGTIDITSFIKKKKLSPAILDLLGEIKDPATLIKDTGAKVAGIAFDAEAQRLIRAYLLESKLASSKPGENNPEHIARVGEEKDTVATYTYDEDGNVVVDEDGVPIAKMQPYSRTKSKLAGLGKLYTNPELQMVLDEFFEPKKEKESSLNQGLEAIAKVSAAGKFAQVILNPAAYPTNAAGGIWTEIANGRVSVNGLQAYGRSYKTPSKKRYLLEDMEALHSMTGREHMERGGLMPEEQHKAEMALRGHLDNSVLAGDVIQNIEAASTGRTGMKDKALWATHLLGKGYQVPDNAAKANAWTYEVNKYAKAYPDMTMDKIMDLASEDVRATTQHYDLVAKFLREHSRHGMAVGTYIAFTYELTRNTIGTAKLAVREMGDDNAVIRMHGYKRLGGLITVGLVMWAAQQAAQAGSDEMRKAINRSYKPPWLKRMGIHVMGVDPGNEVAYFDPTYFIPQAFFYNIINNAIDPEMSDESRFVSAFKSLLQGYGDLNIASQVTSELIANQKVGGGPIWNEERAEVDPLHKHVRWAAHIGDSMFIPGFWRSYRKARQAQSGEIKYMGGTAQPSDFLWNLLSIRPYHVDLEKGTEDRLKQLKFRYSNASAIATERKKGMDPENAGNLQAMEDKAIGNVQKDLQNLSDDAYTLGVSRREFRAMMKKVGVSEKIKPKR